MVSLPALASGKRVHGKKFEAQMSEADAVTGLVEAEVLRLSAQAPVFNTGKNEAQVP